MLILSSGRDSASASIPQGLVMSSEIVPFTADHLDAAVALFVAAYREERSHSPFLPSRALDDPGRLRSLLQSYLDNPGVAVIDGGELLAFMLTGPSFDWKGQRCALVPEVAHSATATQKAALYQRMYMRLAQQWVADGVHVHLVGYLAHDGVLQETLYQLGFGAILAERLRDLSLIDAPHDVPIVELDDVARLVDLELEHTGYYPQSPIFLRREPNAEEARADLEAALAQGDAIFAIEEGGRPVAYLTVGRSSDDGEGLLLRDTNTAQVKGAYAQPAYRGRGFGTALLQRAICWARAQGYDRLMVEHETANVFGGNFWRKYFTPYVTVAMRYVDCTL